MSEQIKMNDTAKDKPSLSQLEAELERITYKGKYKRTFRSTISVLIVTAAAVVLLAFLIFPVFRIYGSSMSPTINEGEIVVTINRRSFERGDVIMLYFNNKLLVKRVIALPDDWVDIDLSGNVYVNGKMIDEPYLNEKMIGECNLDLPYQVPGGRYFVMGDNRNSNQDSRSSVIGGISDEQIVGKVILRLWPWNKIGVIE